MLWELPLMKYLWLVESHREETQLQLDIYWYIYHQSVLLSTDQRDDLLEALSYLTGYTTDVNFFLQEDPETRLGVQESLSLMADAFKDIDPSCQTLMEALIMQNIDQVLRGKRFTVCTKIVIILGTVMFTIRGGCLQYKWYDAHFFKKK